MMSIDEVRREMQQFIVHNPGISKAELSRQIGLCYKSISNFVEDTCKQNSQTMYKLDQFVLELKRNRILFELKNKKRSYLGASVDANSSLGHPK